MKKKRCLQINRVLFLAVKKLEDERTTLGDNKIQNRNTIPLLSRLRVQREIFKHHVYNVLPADRSTHVPLNSYISVALDDSIQSISENKIFSVFDNRNNNVPGKAVYDKSSRIVTFSPKSLLKPNTVYKVTLLADGTEIRYGQLYGNIIWSFATIDKTQNIRITFMKHSATSKYLFSFEKQAGCFGEFKAYAIKKLGCSKHEAVAIQVKNSGAIIEDDFDMLQLRESDTLEIND